MKKIYALAAAMLACGSMLAAPVQQSKVEFDESMRSAIMSEEGMALMRAENAYNDYLYANNIERPGTQKYAYTDPVTGKTWNVRMEVAGKWTDNFDVNSEHWLYYMLKVQVQVYSGSGSTYTRMCHMLVYPSVGFWKETGWGQLFGADKVDRLTADSPVPLQSWDNSTFVSAWKQFLSEQTGDVTKFVVPQASTEANRFQLMSDNDGPAIMNANTPTSDGRKYWQATTSMGWAQVNNDKEQTGCVGEGSSLKFTNYDDETNSIDIPFNGNVVNASNTKTYIYDIKYSGESKILGWQAYQELPLSEMHIVYKGEKSNANNENYDDAEWGPLAQYEVYGAGNGLSWGNWDGANAAHTIPQLYYEQEGTKATFFNGVLYSPAGNADALGIWKATYFEAEQNPFDEDDFLAIEGPKAWTTPLHGYKMVYSDREGLKCAVDGDRWYIVASETNKDNYVISGGEKGSGMQGYSRFMTVLNMYLPAGKDIIYHYDANDITKTKTIANMGSIKNPTNWKNIIKGVTSIFADNDVKANVVTENGKIFVTVDADTMVAVYNMAGMVVKNVKAVKGQTVVIDAANGLYIVRVGNKAAKVIL